MRVAIVGAGNMAAAHARSLRQVAMPTALVGVFDTDADRATAFATEHGTTAYQSLADLLKNARPAVAHICTPAGTHFAPAATLLEAGVSVYIEKPVVEEEHELRSLTRIAKAHRAAIWPGHQLLHDPTYGRFITEARSIGSISLVDSHFAFSPPAQPVHRMAPSSAAAQLIDVLPHPLYSLLDTLRVLDANGADPELIDHAADPFQLYATFRCGSAVGRLSISLTARPVASFITAAGSLGACSVDFIRGAVTATHNPGTSPLEKVFNPTVESVQRAWRSMKGIVARLSRPGVYPGLAENFSAFYRSLLDGTSQAATERQLLGVVTVHETLSRSIRDSVPTSTPTSTIREADEHRPIAVVTGAGGFYGREIVAALQASGYSVRGLGRTPANVEGVARWISADLSAGVPDAALEGADLVVHAAAATSGGMETHRRNTVMATSHLLDAMARTGVRRLIHISSLSVVEPPRGFRQVQTESSPLASRSERLGAYTWGKRESEALVQQRAADGSVEARIIRPGALVDLRWPEVPGLLGRRLFGSWHLGFGRSSLPLPVCDVRAAAQAVATCAEQFEVTPSLINLFDPDVRSRRDLLKSFRATGWRGRFVWVPIPALAIAVWILSRGLAIARGRSVNAPAIWAVLRPRRFDAARSQWIFRSIATGPREASHLVRDSRDIRVATPA